MAQLTLPQFKQTMKKIIFILLIAATGFAQKAAVNNLTIGIKENFKSVSLNENRPLNIYLPQGYAENPSRTYPVVYLLDGAVNEDFIHIVGVVQFLSMIEKMPEAIVVGIANVDRKRDFTFPTTIQKDKIDFPTTGSSAKFIDFLENELQPHITKNYKTNGDKIIVGQSLGGLLATEILIKKPDLFDKYIIISPSLWWDNESLLTQIPGSLQKKSKPSKVFIAVGTEGKKMEEDAKILSEKLKALASDNLKITFKPMPEETHLTILHNSVYKAFEQLYLK